MPGSPLSNNIPQRTSGEGRARLPAGNPSAGLGARGSSETLRAIMVGGRAEYPQSDESIKQSITFVCNMKAGKSPIWRAQQRTHFALLLGSISRKLLIFITAFITCNSTVHPSPSAGDVSCKWAQSNPPTLHEDGSISPGEADTKIRRETAHWAQLCCATFCTGEYNLFLSPAK